MSAKVLQRIALALVFALGLWLSLNLFGARKRDDAGRLTLPRLAADTVDQITLIGPGDTLRISKQGAAWQVNGLPASAKAVQEFLAATGDSSAESELTAQSATSHARLGVDSVAGKRLSILGGGKPLLDLVIGNRGPDLNGYYVRRAGAADVYLLQGQFAELLARHEGDWRERQLSGLKADSIAKVEVQLGKVRWTMSRSGSAWLVGNRPADSTKVARFLSIFGDLRATGFPDRSDLDSIKFAPPERGITLSGPSGQPILALVFDSTPSGSFWVRPAAGGPVYRLDGRTTSLVTPEEKSLEK
jgi:hypothetical protein